MRNAGSGACPQMRSPDPPRRRASESRMLSMRGWLTTRDARAPSAMLNDVCRRRSMPRTSMRLATLAQTISSTNPVTIIRIWSQCSYCSRMLVMPAPPGLRYSVCSGKLRAIVGAHLTPVRAQPLLQLHAHFSFDGRGLRARLDAADQVQPVSVVLVQIGIALDQRLRIQRQKEIGRGAAQSCRRRNPAERFPPR